MKDNTEYYDCKLKWTMLNYCGFLLSMDTLKY